MLTSKKTAKNTVDVERKRKRHQVLSCQEEANQETKRIYSLQRRKVAAVVCARGGSVREAARRMTSVLVSRRQYRGDHGTRVCACACLSIANHGRFVVSQGLTSGEYTIRVKGLLMGNLVFTRKALPHHSLSLFLSPNVSDVSVLLLLLICTVVHLCIRGRATRFEPKTHSCFNKQRKPVFFFSLCVKCHQLQGCGAWNTTGFFPGCKKSFFF